MKKYIVSMGTALVAFGTAAVAFADSAIMFPVASTTALNDSFFTDNGVLIYHVFVVLLAALAALLGLGFAIRHVKKWITGKKA